MRGTEWGLREQEMAVHEWSDPRLAGMARQAAPAPAAGSGRVAATPASAALLLALLAAGITAGWWLP